MQTTQMQTPSVPEKGVRWLDVYEQFLSLERQMNALEQTLLALRPADESTPLAHRPVALGGIWSDVTLTEDDFVLAERSMFAYDPHIVDSQLDEG